MLIFFMENSSLFIVCNGLFIYFKVLREVY